MEQSAWLKFLKVLLTGHQTHPGQGCPVTDKFGLGLDMACAHSGEFMNYLQVLVVSVLV